MRTTSKWGCYINCILKSIASAVMVFYFHRPVLSGILHPLQCFLVEHLTQCGGAKIMNDAEMNGGGMMESRHKIGKCYEI